MFLFARRYLFSPKSHSVINIIATLSLLSLTAPVAAVILLLSIFNGFGSLAESLSSAIDADLRITPTEGVWFDQNMGAEIETIEGISFVSRYGEGTLLVENGARSSVLRVRGVDQHFASHSPLSESISSGEFSTQHGDLDRIVLGNSAAYKLRVHHLHGAMLTLYAMPSTPLSSIVPNISYSSRTVKVAGRFQLDIQSEERYAFSSLRLIQELLGRKGQISAIDITLTPEADLESIRKELHTLLGEGYKIRSRAELNPTLYSIIRYEKWAIMFISTMVILLASFSLIGALSMLIIEKREDIKTLRAMGGSWHFVRRIFWLEGALISFTAISAGTLVGVALALGQQHWGWVKIPSDNLLLKTYPVILNGWDVVAIALISLSISLSLSYFVVKRMVK